MAKLSKTINVAAVAPTVDTATTTDESENTPMSEMNETESPQTDTAQTTDTATVAAPDASVAGDPSTTPATPAKRRGRAPGTVAPPSIGWTDERNTVVLSTVAALNGQNKLYTYSDIADVVKSDPAFAPVANLVTGNAIASHVRQLKRKTEKTVNADGTITTTKPWAWLDDVIHVFHKRGGPRKSYSDAANAAKALFGLA